VFDRAGERVGGLREVALELLVYLVAHRDGVSSSAIRRDVYAAATEQRAAERLSTDLANLRERLRHAAGAGRQVNPIVRVRDGYQLVPGLLDVDWWDVLDDCRRLTEAVRTDADPRRDLEPPSDPEATLRRLAEAFDDGVLADGAGFEWIHALQERSRRTGIAVFRRLAAALAPTDRRSAAAMLDKACDLDPFDEDLARKAIAEHQACGDAAAATARGEAIRAALEELNEFPASATVALMSSPTPRPEQ
jgi:two-component SAPR family response regulator